MSSDASHFIPATFVRCRFNAGFMAISDAVLISSIQQCDTRCSLSLFRAHVYQAGCLRSAAVAALKNNDGDIVNAIMELTMD